MIQKIIESMILKLNRDEGQSTMNLSVNLIGDYSYEYEAVSIFV